MKLAVPGSQHENAPARLGALVQRLPRSDRRPAVRLAVLLGGEVLGVHRLGARDHVFRVLAEELKERARGRHVVRRLPEAAVDAGPRAQA
jgi:hypothetical protein